jgi:long-chain acyl-CoA synthetase
VDESLLGKGLCQAIDASLAAANPEKPFLVGPAPLTYGTLRDRIDRLRTLFDRHGLCMGDRVVIVSGDDCAVISLYFATVRAGLVAVIGNSEAPIAELARLVEAAAPMVIFADPSMIPPDEVRNKFAKGAQVIIIASAPKSLKASLFTKLRREPATKVEQATDRGSYPALLEHIEPTVSSPAVPDSAIAHMLFTSGTTSRPKGVELTHGNIRAQMMTYLSVYGYDSDSRILNVLPLHHADGITQGPLAVFFAGGTLHRPGRFLIQTLPELLSSIQRECITHFIVVPTILSLIMRLDETYDDCFRGPQFRFVKSGADLLDPILWQAFEARFGVEVANAYGLTETVCEATYCGPDPTTKKMGTIGKPIDCEVRFVDESGQDVLLGEVGEVWIRGTNVMKGYFRMPEETAAVLTDGWYHTGDLARTDRDGFITLSGRKKALIIKGGVNVHPEYVTTTIRAIDGVIDAVTFGHKDPAWGETIVSCVVIDANSDLDADAILEYCRKNLSAEAVPATIFLLDCLPRGPAGKVLLEQVKSLADEQANWQAAPNGDIANQILAIAAGAFKVPISTLTPQSTPFNTNGWDSLAHISFITAVERQFGFLMTPSDIINLHALSDAERIVRKAVGTLAKSTSSET